MKQKLVILVHKFDKSLLIVKTQQDLATILGVSLSTVKRCYSATNIYDTDIYTIHVNPKIYDNGVIPKYRTDVEPPKSKLYDNAKRAEMPNNKSTMILSDGFSAHNKPLFDDEAVEQDWREYETNMPLSEYDNYYSKRTLEQLKESAKYFALKPYHMKYINKYGQLRELD
jgi:hypothetical protein